jgi:predicted metal-dependent phosphoesterase TrpH
MLKTFKADLHIHTCLSPCAELDMTPKSIVSKAREKGLDIIAITDHNSSENIQATMNIAEMITVIPGVELTTSEEAHVIALFPQWQLLRKLQDIIDKNLSRTSEKSLLYEQVVVNERDEVEGFHNRLLIEATHLGVMDTLRIIHDIGGIAIACHIDREAFSILTQLGFIPESLEFDALELSWRTTMKKAESLYHDYERYPWITASDAHYLDDIGRIFTEFLIHEPTFDEMRLALMGKDGRGVSF